MTVGEWIDYLQRNTVVMLLPDVRRPSGIRVEFYVVEDGDWG